MIYEKSLYFLSISAESDRCDIYELTYFKGYIQIQWFQQLLETVLLRQSTNIWLRKKYDFSFHKRVLKICLLIIIEFWNADSTLKDIKNFKNGLIPSKIWKRRSLEFST